MTMLCVCYSCINDGFSTKEAEEMQSKDLHAAIQAVQDEQLKISNAEKIFSICTYLDGHLGIGYLRELPMVQSLVLSLT